MNQTGNDHSSTTPGSTPTAYTVGGRACLHSLITPRDPTLPPCSPGGTPQAQEG